MNQKKKIKENYGKWYFLVAVLVIYIIIGLINRSIILSSFRFFILIIKKIILVFIFIFFLMVLIDYFIKPRILVKYTGKNAGLKGWVISIISGIISTGPIYIWYPMLKQLKKKGMKNSYIAAFLYNRAIKLPLLPLFIFYFGLTYTIVLTTIMIIVSIFQGIIVEKYITFTKNE